MSVKLPEPPKMQVPEGAPKIRLSNVHKSFKDKKVLQGVNLEVPTGKSLVIIGGSGTGKSVTLKCILGLIMPDEGSILVDGWETVEEMEAGLNLPAGSLVKTMADYNAHAARGEDPEFHKYPDWVAPLTEGPYAAFDISVGKAVYTGFTLGGLSVSVDAEVLDAAGKPVPGLYAAGACASNLAYDSMGYSTGTCIGESTFFGRQCGINAAAGY